MKYKWFAGIRTNGKEVLREGTWSQVERYFTGKNHCTKMKSFTGPEAAKQFLKDNRKEKLSPLEAELRRTLDKLP